MQQIWTALQHDGPNRLGYLPSQRADPDMLMIGVQVTQTWTVKMDCNPTLWPSSPRIVVQLP